MVRRRHSAQIIVPLGDLWSRQRELPPDPVITNSGIFCMLFSLKLVPGSINRHIRRDGR
jgi:hypothetical protein